MEPRRSPMTSLLGCASLEGLMRLLFAALAGSTVAACGGFAPLPSLDDARVAIGGAAAIDGPAVPPSPAGFVASALILPTTINEARADALDLDGDGTLDNALGTLFVALRGDGLMPEGALATALSHGALIT